MVAAEECWFSPFGFDEIPDMGFRDPPATSGVLAINVSFVLSLALEHQAPLALPHPTTDWLLASIKICKFNSMRHSFGLGQKPTPCCQLTFYCSESAPELAWVVAAGFPRLNSVALDGHAHNCWNQSRWLP